MKFLHGFFTLLASAIILVFAAGWLAEKTGMINGFVLFPEPSEDDDGAAPYFDLIRVPATGPATLTAPIAQEGGSLRFGGENAWLIPVLLGEPARSWQYGFNGHSSRGDAIVARGGGCGDPTVNLLDADLIENSGETLFDRRVFIPAYREYWDPERRVIVALVVNRDTDDDGFLTCTDDAEIQIIPFGGGERITIDRVFNEKQITSIRFDWKREQFTFIEQTETVDGIRSQSVGISLAGELNITEVSETSMLKSAQDAFERTIPQ